MLQKVKDAVIAFGASVVKKVSSILESVKSYFTVSGHNSTRCNFLTRNAMTMAAITCLIMLPGVVLAAVPAGAEAAIAAAVTDVGVIGAAVFLVFLAIKGIKWLIRTL